ncbi:cation-transporting ATPase 13A2 [Callorhinchus milii]|uniref:cation-transporting ATPase 13A2 n=1 Tax=Callorhinchus milii TaxID=7868 RepID=UPI000457138A|nr:cation-transporting ATPase 13A2 [Callorhinchus milii]|eukprot:gi/632977077/ref/XP_007905146.1/ PREDICTED: probable cation-transporting ATPase 13A2 [Callorhinchus milii]
MSSDSSKLLTDQQSCYGAVPHSQATPFMEVKGYQRVQWRVNLCHIFTVLTVGILWLIFRWKPVLEVIAKGSPCHLSQADWVLIKRPINEQFPARVWTEEVEDDYFVHPAGSGEDENHICLAVGVAEDDWKDTIQLQKEEEKSVIRYYISEGFRYIWSEKRQNFCKVCDLDEQLTCADIYRQKTALSRHDQNKKRKVYGPNIIDVPVKPYFTLLVEEVLNPFYIFQILSIALWMAETYYYYAACILFISFISIAVSLYQTRKQSVTLRNMVKLTVKVQVCRDTGEEEMVNSQDLVPGDCIVIPSNGLLMPCDATLLTGECMVNESMLTGESIPVLKTTLPDLDLTYSIDEHKRHTLFCGTQVIQSKNYISEDPVMAVVIRTGYCTAKGDLVSSILYPKPLGFKFYKDAIKFIIFLGLLALIGDIYSVVILVQKKVPVSRLLLRALDLITIIVPPALPAAMTVGTIYAQNRLKKNGIFCISPPRINLCGKLKLICFDKTGTLTEEGLDIWGVVPVESNVFQPIIHEPRHLPDNPLLRTLATCHSISLIGNSLIGDPLDLKMLESIGWDLKENVTEADSIAAFGTRVLAVIQPPPMEEQPYDTKQEIVVGILRRFPFASSLQRMSVLTKRPGSLPTEAYLKGAPEMVASLCLKESVPTDFSEMLRHYARDGYRVLGLAYKVLSPDIAFDALHKLERSYVESEMTFLGFLIMRNVLKAETKPVIISLKQANFQTVMVTGDNMLTALNVARNCGMIDLKDRVIFASASPPTYDKPASLKFILADPIPDQQNGTEIVTYQQETWSQSYHLALNGRSFAVVLEYFPNLLPKILQRGTIYARMAPDQKTQLVENLQKLGYCVGMCGDGANDCGALKAADAGISLSEAEASVASSFTSKINNIECVPILIREGRASLVTSFGIFKYMAMYSLIQFVCVLILYSINSNLGDWQYLFFDLAVTTTIAIFMGRTEPTKELVPQRPLGSLIKVPILGSLVLQTLVIVMIQILTFFITTSQSWFVPINVTSTNTNYLPNYENTVLFCVTGFQYLILATVLSKGQPFRKPLYSNVLFLFTLIILCVLMMIFTLHPFTFMRQILQLMPINDINFKLLLLGFAALHFFTSLLLETAIDSGILTLCLRILYKKKDKKALYKRLEKELSHNSSWPPLNEVIYAEQERAICFE